MAFLAEIKVLSEKFFEVFFWQFSAQKRYIKPRLKKEMSNRVVLYTLYIIFYNALLSIVTAN